MGYLTSIPRCVLLAACLTLAPALAQQPVTIQTGSGPITGGQSTTLRTFFGIPYAAPPVGQLRWKAPQKPVPWTGPLDASAFRSPCTQVVIALFKLPGYKLGDIRGHEDCLYLNVYTPASVTGDSRLPVMVWIHGGSFEYGAGSDYDPDVLTQKHQVITVTLNYRLGAFGFLALQSLNTESDDNSSGNYGVMDQQAALRWVQENIARFGGDPGNVTLFGESAGGMSICAQLASPSAAGLFHRAIIQSGLCGSPGNNVSVADAAKRNAGYASKAGCKGGDAACLRAIDYRTVAVAKVPGRRPLGNLVWSPVYGSPLLPLPLLTAFTQGKFHHVPVMIGTNRDEGRLFLSLAAPGTKPLPLVKYWAGTGLLVGMKNNRKVLSRYPYRDFGTPALAFTSVFTDAIFSCPALRADAALSKFAPVYAFEFNDPDAVTELKPPAGMTSLGSFHSSGLVYVFQTTITNVADPANFTPAQRRLSDSFSDAWATFAKTGDPNSQGQPRWKPFDSRRNNVQAFTPTGISEDETFNDVHKCGLWSDLNLK